MAVLDECRRARPGRDQLRDGGQRALELASAACGRVRLRQDVQIGGGVLVELQRAGHGVDHLRRGVLIAALL